MVLNIGILTFTEGTNIGQRLQNYALQRVIMDCENTVWTLKQRYPFNPIKCNIKKGISFIKTPRGSFRQHKRIKKFDCFNDKYIKFYPEEMSFYGDNSSLANEFDAFVVGSDQIWNPQSPFVGDNYFLTFAKEVQRLTYAPSFSVGEIPDGQKELYQQRLNGFQNITVREDKGALIVEELTGKVAEVVLDPTLLLSVSEWKEIKSPFSGRPENKYILVMFLGVEPKKEVEEIAELLGLQVFYLGCDAVISPDEFLSVVEAAEIVLTDSYHITVFSILYHKAFVNFRRKGTDIDMNSRFETLYRLLGIKNRDWEYLSANTEEIEEMDFSSIDENLERERKRSREILYELLESVSGDLMKV